MSVSMAVSSVLLSNKSDNFGVLVYGSIFGSLQHHLSV